MSTISKHKTKNIFLSLKQTLIGRITDADIKLLKQRFDDFEHRRYKKIPFYKGYAKIIYYQLNKPESYPPNKQWIRVKNILANEQAFIIGSIDDTYTHNGKEHKCYKYYRYYHTYNILELVSDYYNKIPIFYHLSSTGEYPVVNGIECIEGIDNIPKLY